MVGHGGSSASSYLSDPTSPIPSHCASIVVTSTLRVNLILHYRYYIMLYKAPKCNYYFSPVHQFPFLSDLQRMSVIVEDLTDGQEVMLFMKGAPETVVKYCNKNTGISKSADLQKGTFKGSVLYVALAIKGLCVMPS